MESTEERNNPLPLTVEGVEKFLASGYAEGIGPAFARALVARFGVDAIRVLTDNPQLAATVPGIGESRALKASNCLKSLKYSPAVTAFLFSCGITESFIERIESKYKHRTEEMIAEDPYAMVEDVWRLSFFTADKIGRALDISLNDPRRLQGALITAVKHYAEMGHLYATPEEAINYASGITRAGADEVRSIIAQTVKSGRIVESRGGLYLPVFYKAEKEGAKRLIALADTPVSKISMEEIPIVDSQGNTYSAIQRQAILTILNSSVAVLTGGPGTGKTTVLRGVLDVYEIKGINSVLVAPTGRAAKRMTMLTGMEATTIHRLLGYRQGEGYRKRPIETGALIIDEGSMMEQVLFDHLLEALRPGTRVVMVGDVDQLPAIGAGDVLRDLINSGVVAVAKLNENFRQSSGSYIAAGASDINAGKLPESHPDSDFLLIEENSPQSIHSRILRLMEYELPQSHGVSPTDIRVVTPQQIGPLGARQLNIDLQTVLNPDAPELRRGSTSMRLGDPVMQTANSRERGLYNGEIGQITEVDTESQTLKVTFSEGRISTYARSELSELVLAYAMTVHKLQGSEVKYMIFPITMAHKPMLYRNMIYTGVSRATRLCVLVGEIEALRYAIENNPDSTRNSNFAERLRDASKNYN
ncbi:MAG: AAA family ATPase [Muribaculaceae bacterium]|nr:AAA family ATPase [Muribaculaceae bacterium]